MVGFFFLHASTLDLILFQNDLLISFDSTCLGWPAAGLRFKDGVDTGPILQKLIKASQRHKTFDVYTHETMPAKWHFVSRLVYWCGATI